MASYNDLIDVSFVDAALHDILETDDILGVIMPYHWGPAGSINVFNEQEFYDAYPEIINPLVTLDESVYKTYFQVKSYFKNGGSRVAVYRPRVDTEWFGLATEIGDWKLALKYPGLPAQYSDITLSASESSGIWTVGIEIKNAAGAVMISESFEGQVTDSAANEDGEPTYLPTILDQRSRYLTLVDDITPAAIPTTAYTPSAGTETLDSVFGTSDSLAATQFLAYDSALDAYQTACFFSEYVDDPTVVKQRFNLTIDGEEKIKVLGYYRRIPCNAGVAGAYAKVAADNNLNQVASARTYGAYNGIITKDKLFQAVLEDSKKGVISVYNASYGPSIFGVRNAYAFTKASSYFSKANVSRVLSALLRNIKPIAMDAIHTATASDPIMRAQFEVRLNSIIDTFIGSRNLQSDSVAICDGSNNSDGQSQGGQILNILLKLHFIGLVEKVSIKVVATDSSVTTEFV